MDGAAQSLSSLNIAAACASKHTLYLSHDYEAVTDLTVFRNDSGIHSLISN